jgi:hypothetical protein
MFLGCSRIRIVQDSMVVLDSPETSSGDADRVASPGRPQENEFSQRFYQAAEVASAVDYTVVAVVSGIEAVDSSIAPG